MAAALVGLAAAGCGDGPTRVPVEGTVSFDGRPVADGAITFIPADNRGPTAGARIVDGRYAIPRATGIGVGEYRVEIVGNRETGKTVRDPSDPSRRTTLTEQYVPEKYNRNTTLKAKIDAKTTVINYELTRQ
ncbi:hypothetical protein [Fimbriiglobus ruber]|uniref:hypothetical protein n=1 Tax=Fimbriiglobus ruber TaxID=1908690 RepID=UPI00117B6ECE|nr:hypothetical protein [Fimbriiglobus ruber]